MALMRPLKGFIWHLKESYKTPRWSYKALKRSIRALGDLIRRLESLLRDIKGLIRPSKVLIKPLALRAWLLEQRGGLRRPPATICHGLLFTRHHLLIKPLRVL